MTRSAASTAPGIDIGAVVALAASARMGPA